MLFLYANCLLYEERGGGGRKNRGIRRGRREREMVEGAGRMKGERRDEGGREGRREGDVRERRHPRKNAINAQSNANRTEKYRRDAEFIA